MTLSETIIYLTGCSGLTFIVVHSTIMDMLKIRPFLHRFSFFKKLTSCSLCTGTWAGIIFSPVEKGLSFEYILSIGASAAISFLFERTTILLDYKIIEYEKKEEKANINKD